LSDLSPGDELPDIEDWLSSSCTDALVNVLPNIQVLSSLEDDLADILDAYDSGMCDLVTGSASDRVQRPVRKRHSIHGNYKRPKRPRRSRLCLPLFGVSIIDHASDKSGTEQAEVYRRSVSRGKGPSNATQGKFEAEPDMAEPTMQDAGDDQEEINVDYRNAVELERKLNKALHKSQKLEKKNRQMKERLRTLRDRSQITDKTPRATSTVRKSQTPLGIGGKFDRASSRLPAKSGLLRAMTGYRNGNKFLSSSSSSSSRSSHRSDGGTKKLSGSSWSSDEDIFHDEPESDHPSDSEGTKRRKREKRRRHRAKLNALKYHQSFIKNDPPFKYNGEIQISLFKKWCHEVRDWIKDGRLGSRRCIRLSGKYLSGKAYRFFEQNILQKRMEYTLTEYFAALLIISSLPISVCSKGMNLIPVVKRTWQRLIISVSYKIQQTLLVTLRMQMWFSHSGVAANLT
jgi:hypothetical protein